MTRNLRASANITLIVGSILLVLPALALLYFVYSFGVNLVFWDEWDMIPLYEKMIYGSLNLADLFAQHNENRIFFPRVAMLVIERLTAFNTVAEMYLSWILISISSSIMFYMFWTTFGIKKDPKLLALFLPVSLLMFSFRQEEAVLWGFTCQIYFAILGVLAALCFLEKDSNRFLLLSILSGIVASYSFLIGLAIWPMGLIVIGGQNKARRITRSIVWSVSGLAVSALYFNNFVIAGDTRSFNLMEASKYLAVLSGAPLTFDITSSAAVGGVVMLLGVLLITQARRAKILRMNRLWISMIIFAAIFLILTTIGRSGLGTSLALTSRYTPITIIGAAGLYFLAVSVAKHSRSQGANFGFHALLVIFLLGLIVSYSGGWQAGQNTKYSRETGVYVLKTYKIQSDENIITYLFPNPAIVKELAPFLEQHKLNIFSQPIQNSTLTLFRSDTSFTSETTNHEAVSLRSSPIVIHSSRQETITIVGWSIITWTNNVSSGVLVDMDGKKLRFRQHIPKFRLWDSHHFTISGNGVGAPESGSIIH